jgi:hypothetical protein
MHRAVARHRFVFHACNRSKNSHESSKQTEWSGSRAQSYAVIVFPSRKLLRLRHAESKFESIYRRRKSKSKVSGPVQGAESSSQTSFQTTGAAHFARERLVRVLVAAAAASLASLASLVSFAVFFFGFLAGGLSL